MMTGREGILEILVDAFSMEKGTHEFYLKAAEAAHEKVAAEYFGQLARWEQEHMDYLQFLYQSVQDNRDLVTFEEFKKALRPEAIEGGIPVNQALAKIEDYNLTDELGAILAALEIEGKSYNFYRGLSEKAESSNAKVLFQELMEWEKKHVQYLKELRLRIEETS